MKPTQLQMQLAQTAAAAMTVFFTAVLSADFGRFGAVFLSGLLWLALAWRSGLPPLLVAVLLIPAARAQPGASLPLTLLWAGVPGLAAWALLIWRKDRYAAAAAGVLWGGMVWLAPALLPLGLAALLRLGRVAGSHARLARLGAGVVIAASLLRAAAAGTLLPLIDRMGDPAAYHELARAFVDLGGAMSLAVALPLLALLELAQTQSDDSHFSGRNLALAGGLSCLPLLPAAQAVSALYWLGLPLCALPLSRWVLALPGLPSRIVFALVLFGLWIGGVSA